MAEIKLKSVGSTQGDWQMAVSPQELRFTSSTGDLIAVPQVETAGHLEILPGFPGRALLRVWGSGKTLKFLVSSQDAETLLAWSGPPTEDHLRATLRRRYASGLAIALISFIPFLRTAYWASQGANLRPTHLVGPLTSLAYIPLWFHARFRPRAYLFLLEAVWFVLIGLRVSYSILVLRATPLLWILVLLVLNFALGSARLFGRFRDVSESSAGLPGPAV